MPKIAVADLNADHEYEGHWWIPGLEQFRSYGKVSFSQNSLWLQVEGKLIDHLTEDSSHPFVYGQNLQGEKFTLDGAFEINRREEETTELTKSTWYGSRLIKGKHVSAFNEQKYSAMSIQIPGLEFTSTPSQLFGTLRLSKEDEKGNVSGHYYKPENRAFSLVGNDGTKDWTLCLTFGCFDKKELFSLSLEHLAILQVITEEKKSIDWMLEKATEIQNMITLLNGYSTPLRTVAIHDEDSKLLHVLFHHRASVENSSEEKQRQPIILIRDLSDDQLQEFLSSFFSTRGLLKEMVEVFLSILHRKSTFYKTEFIELTQILEAYDRHRNPDACYMERTRYLQEIYPQLVASIPVDLEKEFKTKLKAMLEWGYEYSLRTRLKKIVKELPTEIQTMLCENPSRFSSKISSTRNQITHYSNAGNSECLTDFESTFAIAGLKVLMLSLILLENKIPEELVLQGIKRNRDYLLFKVNKPW